MRLVIFDLDQTLVDVTSVHNEATQILFKKLFGVDARLTEIDFTGKSLIENFLELARLKGIPENRLKEAIKELIENYDRIFGEVLPHEASRYILPGVRKLLEELSKTDNLIVLYTGDSPGIVDRVFQSTDLGKYFKFSLYGTEVEARADMVRLAIENAQRLTGKKFKNKDIVIIGDSVRDIECGQQFNALTIAVATGFHSAEKLSKAGPDYLFKDLRNYKKVLEAIG